MLSKACPSVCAKYLIWQSCFIIKLRGGEWVFRSNDTTRLLLYNIEMKENTRMVKKGLLERNDDPLHDGSASIGLHQLHRGKRGKRNFLHHNPGSARVCSWTTRFVWSIIARVSMLYAWTHLAQQNEREKKMSHSNHHASGSGVDRKKSM